VLSGAGSIWGHAALCDVLSRDACGQERPLSSALPGRDWHRPAITSDYSALGKRFELENSKHKEFRPFDRNIWNEINMHVGPPLWSSGRSSWLQIQMPGFDSWRYQIFWEIVGQERGPLSLVSTIEELLERKSSGSGLENWDYDCRYPSRWPRGTPLSAKVDTNFADKRWSE
jgi:hypothetical protein